MERYAYSLSVGDIFLSENTVCLFNILSDLFDLFLVLFSRDSYLWYKRLERKKSRLAFYQFQHCSIRSCEADAII